LIRSNGSGAVDCSRRISSMAAISPMSRESIMARPLDPIGMGYTP
jgi:hypothetical protein